MVSIQNPRRPLPPLQVETNYIAQDFEEFEYFGSKLTEGKAILRLHLKNQTTIDLPCNDDELQRLMLILCENFPQRAVSHVRERWPRET